MVAYDGLALNLTLGRVLKGQCKILLYCAIIAYPSNALRRAFIR